MYTTYLRQATLLYVEDDETIRTLIAARIGRKVNEIIVAVDGKDGLEKFKEFKPDIVLTDVTMPKMTGIEMATEIKKIDKNIPIVISSAHNDSKFLLEAIEIGIEGYLLKPIDKEKLFNILEEKVKPKFIEKELEEKKQQLLHQSRFALLGEMVSMIAHQWRQPLNLIALTMTSLRMKITLNKFNLEKKEGRESFADKVEKDLINVENRVDLLSSVIDDFSTFYKPNDTTDVFHINQILKEAVISFKDSLEIKDIHIEEEYNSSKDVKLYKDIFMQICLNLLNNAHENFIQKEIENPKIVINTQDTENDIEMSILDNAGGIETELMNKIFDPYFSTKMEKNGNGLGLYMTKLIIEEHLNGEIKAQNVNGGAKFTIKLKEQHD